MQSKGDRVPVKQEDEDDFEDVAVVEDQAMAVMKGEVQAPEFRDWPWAVLFLIQVAAIATTALTFGPAAIASLSETSDNDESFVGLNDDETLNYANNEIGDDGLNRFLSDGDKSSWTASDSVLFTVGAFFGASVVVMSMFRILLHFPLQSIKISFFLAPGVFAIVALLILMASAPSDSNDQGDVHATIVGSFWMMAAIFSFISLCYYYCFKRFMPFAAVNLRAALTAVRSNSGLFFLSFGALFAIFAWSTMWGIAMSGIFYHDQQKDEVPCSELYNDDYTEHPGMCEQQPSMAAIAMLILCTMWTQQVIQNTVHTTTAGAVGSWWVQSIEAESTNGSGCCGQDVSDSLYRSCTYSFGSICFGSLLVAILQTLESMARNRNRRDVLSIVLQCLVICLRAWLEYFNSWAFCYVGIYGYSYVTAGRKVIELFKARGWTTLITDRLVFRVLMMANFGCAALSGLVCVLLMLFLGFSKFTKDDWAAALVVAFWVGFVIGLIISNTVLFVVESAVRTVMVCFAEQPLVDQQDARPILQELKETYAATYPDIFRFSNDTEMETRNVV